MPDLLAATFAATGGDMDDHLELTRLDPAYRVLRRRQRAACADRDAMAAEVASAPGPAEAERFDRYCDWLGRLCRLEVPSFLDRNYDHVTDLGAPAGPRPRSPAPAATARPPWPAFHDDRLRRLLQSSSAWTAPHRALGVLAVIGYMDVVAGVWAACGGCTPLRPAWRTPWPRPGVASATGGRSTKSCSPTATEAPSGACTPRATW